jgi:pimeloyl-ACP methyl ester carboxylesterase
MERDIELPQGTVRVYEEGDGPVLFFVHGLMVSHTLWELVVERLSESHRCVSIDLPLGAHRTPMGADADLSPRGLAAMIAGVMEQLTCATSCSWGTTPAVRSVSWWWRTTLSAWRDSS